MQIEELKIYTTRLSDQKYFYSKILGLNIYKQSENNISFKIGNSFLKIESRLNSTPYHFAINIPANKEIEALNWLKSKVKILKNGDNEIQDFEFWNAKAIYFYDKDKNIVELIARKNLQNKSDKEFDQNLFLEISEIGIPTTDIEKEFKKLNKISGIKVFDGGFERFCAIGNENGLFICINKNIKDWFPTNDKAFSSDFEVTIKVNKSQFRIEYQNEKINTVTNNAYPKF